jgi:hypothetical protein
VDAIEEEEVPMAVAAVYQLPLQHEKKVLWPH